MQDYNIEITKEWLSKTTSRKFKVLLNGLTKNTAVGNYFISKELSKNKTHRNDNKRDLSFNPKNKNSMNMFHTFAKSFAEKGK